MTDLITSPTPPTIQPNVTSTISTSGGVNVQATDVLYSTSTDRMFDTNFDPDNSTQSFVNSGTIWNDHDGSEVFYQMNWGRITNSGTIVAHSSGHTAQTIDIWSSFTGPLTNSGSIYAISDGDTAWAIQDWSSALVVNSGTIAARGATYARAIYAWNGGAVENDAGGSILAEGADAIAIFLGAGHSDAGISDVANWGLISAQSTDPNNASVAIEIGHYAGDHPETIENYGVIAGDFAILATPYAATTAQASLEAVTNHAGALIQGEIALTLGDDTLTNAGEIDGYVDMGEGDDLVDNQAGTHVGDTELGWGSDTYLGGVGPDAVTGDRGNDTLLGGAGDDLLLGGWGDDQIQGQMGNDGLYGEGGNDTIVTAAGDFVDAGDGDDRVILSDYHFAKIEGGSGHDVLVLPADDRVLSLSQAISSGRVSGFEEIELASGDHIVVHAEDVGALTGGSKMVISAEGSGIVDLAGSWTVGTSQTIDGVIYRNYSSGTSQLAIQSGITVNNGVEVAGSGLDAIASGAAAPLPGDVPGTDLTPNSIETGTVFLDSDANFRTADLVIDASEVWTSLPGTVLFTTDSSLVPSVINYGTLNAVGPGGAGVFTGDNYWNLFNYGTINSTSLDGTAKLAANKSDFQTYGLYNEAPNLIGNVFGVNVGSVWNFLNAGTIAVQSSQTMAIGYMTYGGRPGESTGAIKASSSDFVAVGVYAHNGGSFVNSGEITATAGWQAYAVASSAALQLTNSGAITAQTTGTGTGSQAIAILLEGNGTVHNFGTITGATAIDSYGNAVALDNSGTITGSILFGTVSTFAPADDVIINTGTINGSVSLGAGRDVYDGQGGTQIGTVNGGDGNDLLIGTSGHDTLVGGTGDDALVGAGGDTLTGGVGSDTFAYIAAAGNIEKITDFVSGTDHIDLRALAPSSISIKSSTVTVVTASGTLTIQATGAVAMKDIITVDGVSGSSVGSGGLTGAAGSPLTGSDGVDFLVGSAGNDHLDGKGGGSGAYGSGQFNDVLAGGAGDDTYVVHSSGDLIVEAANGGTDSMVVAADATSGTFWMSENVENFSGGSAYGNALDNVMTGTAAGNMLNGGDGNDTIEGLGGGDLLTGGAGADLFVISPPIAGAKPDEITDFEHGIDTIDVSALQPTSIAINYPGDYQAKYSAVTFNTPAGTVTLRVDGYVDESDFGTAFKVTAGTGGNDNMAGTSQPDWLDGGSGNDTLSGGLGSDTLHGGAGNDELIGGDGHDALIGGAGADRFYVTGTSASSDLIGDFSAQDTLYLESAVFAVLPLGNVSRNDFTVLGPNMQTNTHIVYIPNSGEVWYYPETFDGSSAQAILIATVQPNAPVTAASFVVYSGDPLTVQSSVTYTLGANETNLQLTGAAAIDGTGNSAANVITGNDAANHLSGLAGNDTLIGNGGNDTLDGGAGVDTMSGGAGDDIYIVDNAHDVVTENTGEGTDTVQSSVSFTLGTNVENLTFTGSAATYGYGNSGVNVITGNDAVNVISAGSGNDTLIGNGGNDRLTGGGGADVMIGGAGGDTYYVDNVGDTVTELANEGTDTVRSSVSFTLGDNVERLTLTGSAAIDGTGNALGNVLYGNDANNRIDGGDGSDMIIGYGGDDTLIGGGGNDHLDGRTGADTMVGGLGNDVYYVDSANDTVTENANEGTDLVFSTLSYTLGANLERLTLTGSAAVDGTGNDLNNVIRGNDANNHIDGGNGDDVLSGLGGDDVIIGGAGNDKLYGNAGADTMIGGAGNDAYYVDDAGDSVTENAGEGSDTVVSTLSYTLGANLERLVLSGTADISGTGNILDNKITGNSGNNLIDGADGNDTLVGGAGDDIIIGGAGKDTLTGGAGNDLFVFHGGDFGGDRITDFTSGQDRIDLSAVDANTLLSGDQSFIFVGTNAFSHTVGELRYEQISGSTYLTADTDGDGVADITIVLEGLHSVNSGDLVL